jgi:16S rRNA (uracil1498-N3)-methyltransferase
MKQFILPAPPDPQGMVRLSGKDFHYLARVRRLREGAVFKARLPEGDAGTEVRLRVLSLAGDCLTGECLPTEPAALQGTEAALPPIILFQALPKGAKLDLIVRQAAEGGIRSIRPFVSDYSAPRTEGPGRLERWRRIIREARQQSGSAVATDIAAPCAVGPLLEHWEALKSRAARPVGIILHQDPVSSEHAGFHDCLYGNPDLVALAVGPEGGFSPHEVSRFLSAGFRPLVMGNTILRTETAALYAAAAVRIILLESTTWTLTAPKR